MQSVPSCYSENQAQNYMMEEPQITSPTTSITTAKVLIVMADYGHDPTGSLALEEMTAFLI